MSKDGNQAVAPPARPCEGALFLVATPIGNLGDMTLRAIETLRQVDVVAAEDTRRAGILCRHYGIQTRLLAYHAHNEHRLTERLLDDVVAGKRVAVLSDAGTPAIADPGFLIVRAAYERGLAPSIIPGVSALTFAVVACGLPVDRFAFLGFPPVKVGKRHTFLCEAVRLRMTVFIYEAPHRLAKLLREIHETMGPATPVAVIREATKVYEECIRGTIGDILAAHGETAWRGECVVAINTREVVEPPPVGNEARRIRKKISPATSPTANDRRKPES